MWLAFLLSSSAGTPGLRTAGVVIFSVGLGVPYLILILIICVLCYVVCSLLASCLSRAREWLNEALENRQETKG